MNKVLKLLVALSVSTSCYAMDLPEPDQQGSPTPSLKLLDKTIESQAYEKGSLPAYRKSLKEAKTNDDLLRILADISKDSCMLTAHKEVAFPEDIPYSETYPLIFGTEGHFIFGCDDDELIIGVTARNADYYAVLSDLQDRLFESGLATNCVHVVGEADEVQFPSFRFYFSECKRLGLLPQTLAFDLKKNLGLLKLIDKANRVSTQDPHKIDVGSIVVFISGMPGCPYDQYAEGFGKTIIREYIAQLTQNENFSEALDVFNASHEKTCSTLDHYYAIKNFVGSYPELLILNDYDTIVPKPGGSFQELQESSDLSEPQKESLNIIINKIIKIQNHFEELKESYRPAHDQLLKEVITREGIVPLSVRGAMQCRSAFLNQDGNKFLPEMLSTIGENLYDISDIESFFRFFHESGTLIKTLKDEKKVPDTLNLLDVHLILQRLPLSKENAKKLGNSYKMLGEFHMGEKVYGFPIQMHGLGVNQYIVLNLLYQMMSNSQAISHEELGKKTLLIEDILIKDKTVMIPISSYAKHADNKATSIAFDWETKKFNLPQSFIETQEKMRERALEKFSKETYENRPTYYVLDQSGMIFGMLDWWFFERK